MAQYPSLPLFTDAFIADTTHLNAAQTGAYIMLLMIAWRTPDCRLENNDDSLARYARMDKRTWKANKEVILRFWNIDENGYIYQARLVDERKYVSDLSNKNAAAVKVRWLKNKKTSDTNVLPNAYVNDTPTPTPTPTPKESKSRGTRLQLVSIPDEWIDFCKQERPDLEPQDVFNRFRDYWVAKAGKDGVKLDWLATWRNWVRADKTSKPNKTRGKTMSIEEATKKFL